MTIISRMARPLLRKEKCLESDDNCSLTFLLRKMPFRRLVFLVTVVWGIRICGNGGRSPNEEVTYTNSWAVEVPGGREVADDVARRHGFTNAGQVGSLKDTYHFIHAFSPSRSKRFLHAPHQLLTTDSRVLYAEQQVAKRRVKREDYHSPTNNMWAKQWYLHRSNHHDMNVERAWEEGATGKGVVITILDDGIEHTHPDLQDNYDAMASYDFNAHDNDPFPRYDVTNENKHGTRCAGEVAAKRDGKCGSGAAYLSSIGGVRMLDGSVTDVVESSSLHLNPQHIDIYSSSWGPSDNGQTVDGPGRLAKKAFVEGVRMGRGGLGSIYVWAAGNGGRNGDSCNCDGYAVSPYTISIGSVSQNDQFPWYAEFCSSTLSSTYSSGSGAEKQIVSTDLHHRCTDRHTGTSASAPLAAGIMALALQTNQNLTWRDMQYLVIYASNPDLPRDGDFHKNGAGLQVSHKYGFGVLDAAAIVNRARWWVSVPPQINCTFSVDVSSISKATKSKRLEATVDSSSCDITYLEHVQAITTVKLSGAFRRDLVMKLQSPSGTTSTLLPRRNRDRHSDGFHDWPFMTVHSWGEDSRGKWVFSIEMNDAKGEATLEKLELILFGTKMTPRSVRNVPPECHKECEKGCADTGAKFCDSCKNFRREDTLECVTECVAGMHEDHHMCRRCPNLCNHCTNSTKCLQCAENAVRLVNGSCALSCGVSFFETEDKTCHTCHSSCTDCTGPEDTDCITCHAQFIKGSDGRCVVPPPCEAAEYFDSRSLECRTCHESCAECVGKGAKECTECHEGFFLESGVCVVAVSSTKRCKPGHFFDEELKSCKACSANCQRCTDEITCLSCDKDYYLWTERLEDSQLEFTSCTATCPKGFHGDKTSLSCQSCPSYCSECESHDECTACASDFAVPVNGQCPQPCHDGQYFDFNTKHCHPCLENCALCRNSETCISCKLEFLLVSNSNCVGVCPEHLVEDRKNGVCLSVACHELCETCFGEEPDQCLSCRGDIALLVEHSCIENCPDHTYFDESTSSCKHCHDSCASCAGANSDNCRECPNGTYLNHYTCLSACPEKTFVLNNECVACPDHCEKCSSAESCVLCGDGFLLKENKCVEFCKERYAEEGKECKPCPSGCATCSNPLACDSCLKDKLYYKPDRSCLEKCPPGYYGDTISEICKVCSSQCSECIGPHSSQCTLCSTHSAMEKINHTCIPCCKTEGTSPLPCCDCDKDPINCVLLTSLRDFTSTDDSSSSLSSSSSLLGRSRTGLALLLIITAVIAAIMGGIALFYLATKIRQRTGGVSYTPLNSKRGDLSATLALVEEDSDSGSEAELFAKTGNGV